jgi:hypothetical protein
LPSGGGHDSGWQASTFYQDTGLAPLTVYTYTVKARDRSPSLNQTAESTAESATTDSSGGGLPYADSFASGGFAAGHWTTSGTAEVKSQAAYEGSYGARIAGTAWMETALDTSGYTSIHLKYVCKTFQLDGQSENEWFYAEWYDGSSWHTVNQMNVGSWTAYDHALGSGAANNPSFKVRFRVNANMSMERADIDNIEVTGS